MRKRIQTDQRKLRPHLRDFQFALQCTGAVFFPPFHQGKEDRGAIANANDTVLMRLVLANVQQTFIDGCYVWGTLCLCGMNKNLESKSFPDRMQLDLQGWQSVYGNAVRSSGPCFLIPDSKEGSRRATDW